MDAYNPNEANFVGIIGAAEVTAVTIPPASIGAAHAFALATRALISDYLLGRLFALRRDGTIVPLAGSGVPTQIRDPGRRRWDGSLALDVPLNQVAKATVDPLTGRVWFAEQNSHLVRLILPNGTLYTAAGTGTDKPATAGCIENSPEAINLWYPSAAVWDAPRRRLLIVNSGYKCIMALADGGDWVYRLVGGRALADGAVYADGTHALNYFLRNPQTVVVAEADDLDMGADGTGAPGSGWGSSTSGAGGSNSSSSSSGSGSGSGSASEEAWRYTDANATLLISDAAAHQIVAVAPDQRVYALAGLRVVAEEEAAPWSPPYRDGTAAVSTGINLPRGMTYSFTQRAAFFAEFQRGLIRRLRCADAPIPTPSPVPTPTASVTPLPRAQAPGFCAGGDIVVSAAVAGNGDPVPLGAGNGGPPLAASFDGALISVALAPALPSGRTPHGFNASEESGAMWFRANATTQGQGSSGSSSSSFASSSAPLSFASGGFGRARYAYTADRMTVRGIRLPDPSAHPGTALREGRMAHHNILGGGAPAAEGASTGIRLGRPGNESFFSAVVRLALDVAGERLFVSLDAENTVVAVSLSTGVVSAFAGRPGGTRSTSIDCETCLALDATFAGTGGIAWDEPRQRLFIAQPASKIVRAVTAQLTMQSVAGSGKSGSSSSAVGGLATQYSFINYVENVALSPSGDILYVTDRSTGVVAVRVTPGAPYIIAATIYLNYRQPVRLASITVVNATAAALSAAAAAELQGTGDAAGGMNTASGSQFDSSLGAAGVSLLLTDSGDPRLLALHMANDGLRVADGSGGSPAAALSAITPSSIDGSSAAAAATAANISFLSSAPAIDPVTHTVYASSMASVQLFALTCAPPSPSPSPSVPPSPSATRSFGYRTAAELAAAAAVEAAVVAAALEAQAAAATARSAGIAAGVLIPAVAVPIVVAAVAVWLLYLRRARARRQRAARKLARLVAAQRLLALQSDLLDSQNTHTSALHGSGGSGGASVTIGMSSSRGLLDGLALLAAVARDNTPLLQILAVWGDADGGGDSSEAGTSAAPSLSSPVTSAVSTFSRADTQKAVLRNGARAAARGEVSRVASAGGGSSVVASLQGAVAARVVRDLFAEGEAAAAAAAAAAARTQGVLLSHGKSGVARSARFSHLSATDDSDSASASGSCSASDVAVPDRRDALSALLHALPDAKAWESAACNAIAAAATPLAAPHSLHALLQGCAAGPHSAQHRQQSSQRGVLLSALVDYSVDSLMASSVTHSSSSASGCWFDSLDDATQRALAAPELVSLCSSFLAEQYGGLQLGDAALSSNTAAVPLALLLQAAVAQRPTAAAPAINGGAGSPCAAVASIALQDWRAARRSARASRRSKRRDACASGPTGAADHDDDDDVVVVAVEVGCVESATAAAAADGSAFETAAALAVSSSRSPVSSSGVVETVLVNSSSARRAATASASRPQPQFASAGAAVSPLDVRSQARAAVEALVLLSLSSAARAAGQALVRTVAADAAAADDDDADAHDRSSAGAGSGGVGGAGGSSLDLALQVDKLLHSHAGRVSASSAASAADVASAAPRDRRRSGRRSQRPSGKLRRGDDGEADDCASEATVCEASDDGDDSAVEAEEDEENESDADDDSYDGDASLDDAHGSDGDAAQGASAAYSSRGRGGLASDKPLHKRGSDARSGSVDRARQRIEDLLNEQLGGLTALAQSSDRAARRVAWDSAVADVANCAMRVLCCCCLWCGCGCCRQRLQPRAPAYEPALLGHVANPVHTKQRKWSRAAARPSARSGSSLQALMELHQRGGGKTPAAGLDASAVSPLVLMLAQAKGLSLDSTSSSSSPATARSTCEPGLPMTAEQQRRMRVALAARQQQVPAVGLHHHHHHQAALVVQAAASATSVAGGAVPSYSLSTSESTVTFITSPLLPYVAARAPGPP